MRKLLIALAVALVALGAAEMALRAAFGLGSPPLYVASEAYEYIQAPNQRLHRFGNLILTNERSMRSAPVDPQACPVVLFIGDSVVNGGAPTDQDDLATTRIERALEQAGYPAAQVLNASAGSWGPDNAVAYLAEHADLEADLVVGVWSSHDAGDEMTHKEVVGRNVAFPERPPLSAIGEAAERYVQPRWKRLYKRVFRGEKKRSVSKSDAEEDEASTLNPGWAGMVAYAAEREVPLLVYLHPETGEIRADRYDAEGREILDYLAAVGVPVVEGLEAAADTSLYRDYIHPNEAGQRRMAEALLPRISTMLEAQALDCETGEGRGDAKTQAVTSGA